MTEIVIEDVIEDLVRVQQFDPESLIQKSRLGDEFAFDDAVGPAKRLIALFSKLPKDAVDGFAFQQLQQIQNLSKAAFNLFDQILKFNARGGDPENQHKAMITQLGESYQQNFTQLFPFISYAVARTVDFNQLSADGRAAVQGIHDQADSILKELDKQKIEAAAILTEVRAAAAEQGVSQQAKYFKDQADHHKDESDNWKKYTVRMAVAVGVYGVLAMFFHKIPWLATDSLADAIQITAGKLLVFFIISYMLSLCAKNFLSNRHNEIVNRHRQNALMTYKALVDAGGTPEARDAVLNHAAGSIYSLHDTGYSKYADKQGTSSSSVVGLIPKATLPIDT